MMQAGPEIRSTLADGQFERRLGLIITQISGLAFSRYVLKVPLVVALKREDIIQFLGATVQRYLSEKIKT
jgi:hypothetical protein